MHRCTTQLNVTQDTKPTAVSSVESVAVADSATAHDKGAVNTDAATAATVRIAYTLADQHVKKVEGTTTTQVCAPVFTKSTASRDAASDHRKNPAPEVEATCIPTRRCVHGVASMDVPIDEPALSAITKEDATTTGAGAAVDDRCLLHLHWQLVKKLSGDAKVPVSWHGVESRQRCQPESLCPSYISLGTLLASTQAHWGGCEQGVIGTM